ncbi:MAG: DUF4124 domain-containing protein [Lautropia sp.]|nr:DUF4124 domain-containing protein [Lautropia sp.]
MKFPLWLFLLSMLVASGAQAQVHKCVVQGKTTYQAEPCERGAMGKVVGQPPAQKVKVKLAQKRVDLPWDGLHAGMSAAEVKAALAGVKDWDGPALSQMPAEGRLQMQNVTVAGVPMEARYYFVDDHLYTVVLVHQWANESRLAQPNEAAQADLERLERFFQQRFGVPRMRLPMSVRWQLPDQAELALNLVSVAASSSSVVVGFRPPAH